MNTSQEKLSTQEALLRAAHECLFVQAQLDMSNMWLRPRYERYEMTLVHQENPSVYFLTADLRRPHLMDIKSFIWRS